INPHFAKSLPAEMQNDWDQDEQLPISLKQAWERNLMLLRPSIENQLALKQAMDDQQRFDARFAIDINSDSIKIVTPENKSFLIAQGFPLEVNLEWRGAGRIKPPYIVSMWKGTEKPEIVARTDQTEHRLVFREYGEYTVAVQSVEDGRASPPS